MHSARFGKAVVITDHARARMAERGIDETMLSDLIETGDLKRIDDQHLFVHKHFAARHDNLVCAAAVEEEFLVIKTVMVNWTLREQT
jgi:hypothetical protein